MQTESTGSMCVVRWLGALGVVAAPFVLGSGCTAGEATTEETSTVEQAATTCVCVDSDLCGRDTCTSTIGTGKCPLLCDRTEVKCFVQSDGTHCVTSGGLAGTCSSGVCVSTACSGCINSKGLCVEGTSVSACGSGGAECENCDDKNPCTTDSCYSTKIGRYCRHVAVSAGTTCPGGVCVGTSCCTGCVTENGTCSAGTSPAACGIGGVSCKECPDTDNNPCTTAACTADGECAMANLPEGSSCADADACNGTEKCNGSGTCKPGTPLNCDDGNPCTIESCDTETGCKEPVPNPDAPCSDGNACTSGDRCNDEGVCQPGTPISCDDKQTCTADSCDETTGQCLHEPLPDDSECDDGNGCTDNDKCTDGKCGGVGTTCEDRGPCVLSVCENDGENDICTYSTAPLEGAACLGDPCMVGQTCEAGVCTGGDPKDCNDNNPCTEDTCDSDTGRCVNTPFSSECSDGNPCTVDDACNDEGECEGTPMECPAPLDCYGAGECSESSGLCSYPLKPNGSECPGGECKDGHCEVIAGAGAGGVDGGGGTGGSGLPPQGGDTGSAQAGSTSAPQAGAPSQGGSTAGGGGSVAQAGSAETAGGNVNTAGSDNETGGRQSTGDDDDDATVGTAGAEAAAAAGSPGSADDDDDTAGSAGQVGKVFHRDPGGCDCRTSTNDPGTGWLALVLGLVLLGRRRRY